MEPLITTPGPFLKYQYELTWIARLRWWHGYVWSMVPPHI